MRGTPSSDALFLCLRLTPFAAGGVSSLTGTAVSSSSSSNSLASTIRSATGTLLRRLHSPSKSSASLASLAPTIIAEPEPPSLVSTFTESPRPPTPKIYPSLSPTSIASYSASPRPTVGSMIDSPRSYISGGIRVVNLQAEESESDMSKGDMSLDDVSFDAVPKGTTHLGRLKSGDTPPPAPSPAFTFGSPSNATEAASSSFTFSTFPSAPTSSTEPASGNSKTAAELVMEEMNRRALESRAAGPPKFSFGGGSGTGSGMAPSTAEKGKRKFEESHSRAFDR